MTYKGFIYQEEKSRSNETKGIKVTICNNEKGKYGRVILGSTNKIFCENTEIRKQVLEFFFKRSVDNFLAKSERSFRKYNYSHEFVLGIYVAFMHYYCGYGTDSVATGFMIN